MRAGRVVGRVLAGLLLLSLAVQPAPQVSAQATPRPAELLLQEDGADVASQLGRVLSAAVDHVTASPPLERQGFGTMRQLQSDSLGGQRGGMRVSGIRLGGPGPARHEVTLDLEDFALEEAPSLQGTLHYSFVVDDTVTPPAVHGLASGTVDLGGRFGGQAEVRVLVVNGQVASMTVVSPGTRLVVGDREPPPFLTFVTTVAGTGQAGYEDGPGAVAQFNEPRGIVVDDEGRIYVADTRNKAIREIAPDGTVTTLAAGLKQPRDVGLDGRGGLVVSDNVGGHGADEWPLLRVILDGPAKGSMVPIVPGHQSNMGLSIFGGRGLECRIWGSCDGWPGMAGVRWAHGIDVQGGSTLLVQTALPPALRMVTPDGYTMTLKTHDDPLMPTESDCQFLPQDVAKGNRGEIYFSSSCHTIGVLETDGRLVRLAGRGPPTLGREDGFGLEARFAYPDGIVFDGERYLYVADSSNYLVRRVDVQTGEVVRVAGCGFLCGGRMQGGLGDAAVFGQTAGVALDRWGDLYVTDRGNHVVHLIRIIADPQRQPSVHRFDPYVLQRGQQTTITVLGRNLGLVEQIDLGPGVQADIERTGYRQALLNVSVAPDAPLGPRPMSVTTPFGTFTTPPGLALRVIEPGSGVQVTTIAGTGEWSPGFNDGPAEKAKLAFPVGIHAINPGRVLVADPLEQRVRVVATRPEAAREVLELALASAGEYGQITGAVLSALGSLGNKLSSFGLGNFLGEPEAKILEVINKGFDEMCREAGSDCAWISLPWAGVPMSPGTANGLRVAATLFFPTDVAQGGEKVFYIADAGNARVRPVGLDPSKSPPAPKPHFVFSGRSTPSASLAVSASGTNVYGSMSANATISQEALGRSVQEAWAGTSHNISCVKSGADPKQPLGVPLGTAAAGDFLFAADPYCQTIWRIRTGGAAPAVVDMRSSLGRESVGIGKCADGPIAFATFGAPMDVAADKQGNLWVADADCHSIRLIKDLGQGKDFQSIASSVDEFLGSVAERLASNTVESIRNKLAALDTEFLDANRWWVTTVAGSVDGKGGYQDGPASQARFFAPTGISVAESGGRTHVFVSDTGNKRIRLISLP